MIALDILLVSATLDEVLPFRQSLGSGNVIDAYTSRFTTSKYTIDSLITGVGIALTSAHVSRALATKKYNLVINAGICGAYNRNIAMGEVVNVTSDYFPEIGVDNNGTFVSMFEMKFCEPNNFPFSNGKLQAQMIENLTLLNDFCKVTANTVNTCSGSNSVIASVLECNMADIETMEGAAFMLSCLIANVPFIQLRAVSNYVEIRNPQNWNIPLAIRNLNKSITDVLNSFQ